LERKETPVGLFSNPHKWAASMVVTWPRFWTFAVALTGVLAYVVYSAAFEGWRPAAAIAVFLAVYQLGILYALRRILTRAPGQWS
jgi:hypothetical protein